MTVSQLTPVPHPQDLRNQAQINKPQPPARPPADSVQLSATAAAQLKSADTDGDGH
jgi:hypothetical protein